MVNVGPGHLFSVALDSAPTKTPQRHIEIGECVCLFVCVFWVVHQHRIEFIRAVRCGNHANVFFVLFITFLIDDLLFYKKYTSNFSLYLLAKRKPKNMF